MIASIQERLEKYNVTWDSPSKDSSGSMPIGNGDFGANVWVEPNGDLVLLLSKSDAWDENCSLLKLGRMRLRFSPALDVQPGSFQQTLDIASAEIRISSATANVRIWVEALNPVMQIEVDSPSPVVVSVQLEMWRTQDTAIKTQTSDLFKNLNGKDPYPTMVSPDHLLHSAENRILWCHHNAPQQNDGFEINMRLQGLGGLLPNMRHPLKGRTFGASIEGAGLVSKSDAILESESPGRSYRVSIYADTQSRSTVEEWQDGMEEALIPVHSASDLEYVRRQRIESWMGRWKQSWIFINAADSYELTRAHALQRYMNVCAGRWKSPIKHNGSIFSVGQGDDPDFRRWGGPGWWFMNQRLIYWPMIAAGDWDLLALWLRMYRNTLELQKHRTRTYFKHGGAHYPETIMFWGAEVSAHYGWTPFEQRTHPEAECPYLTYYWSGGIELTLILLEYFRYTGDENFAREFLLPIADAITEFYDLHYPRDERGKIRFTPAQALETWHEATNPLPEIAGLRYLLPKLLEFLPLPPGEGRGEGVFSGGNASAKEATLTSSLFRRERGPEPDPARLRERCERMLQEIPDIPTGEKDGKRVILPAEKFDKKKNTENPELYSIFPYRLHGVGKPDLELARDTFEARLHKSHQCWSQDEIQMALLGLTDQAKESLLKRASPESHSDSRFPAFWNAFKDWCPDIDHGGVLQMALQYMLMQCEGREIRLLPAWPKEWDVDFKLHAPFKTTVEAKVRNGQIVELTVTPESRRSDVLIG